LVDELAARTGWRRAYVALLVFLAVLAIVAVLVMIAGARLGAELRALSREGPGIIQSVVDHLTGGSNRSSSSVKALRRWSWAGAWTSRCAMTRDPKSGHPGRARRV